MTTIRIVSHVHSDWSYDGSWSLPALAEAFARRGYDAVLMAEHDRGFDANRWAAFRAACAEASRERIILIPGIEYSDPSDSVHIPVWGDIPFLGEGLETEVLLPRAAEAGAFTVLAHPARRQVLDRLDPALLAHLGGLEVWNRKYDGIAPNREAARLLRRRPELLPMVSLDFHTARQFHPLAMMIEIDGPPGETAVCEAFMTRRARATAFGLDAQGLALSPAWPAMRGLERGRKRAARQARRVQATLRAR